MNLAPTPLNRAVAAHLAGRFEEAESAYRALASADDDAAYNLVRLLLALGRLEDVEPMLRPAAAQGQADARFDLAGVLLAQGRYAEGWPFYESRRETSPYGLPPGYSPEQEWRGEDLGGRSLTVLSEQGFGDMLMFGRFVDVLRDQSETVSYVCPAALAPLLPGAVTEVPPADRWVYAGSLPGLMQVRLDNLPPPVRLGVKARPGAGVGVCVEGSKTHLSDSWRSLRGPDREAILALGRDLSPEATGARDFRDTAEIVADLDLVITVDTSVAHLAASLGKPTWVLLSGYRTDWRWLRGRRDSPWYPTIRLFRQPAPGDWAAVVEDVRNALAERDR